MKKIFTLFIAAFAVANSFGQVATWNTFGVTATTGSTQGYAPATIDANVTSSGLVAADSVHRLSTAKVWGGGNWAVNTAKDGIDSLKYITFSLTPKAGYSLSLTGLDSLRYRSSAKGPISFLLQYAVAGGAFTDIQTFNYARPTATTNGAVAPVDLSTFKDLQAVTSTVTFRLVPFNSPTSGGSFYIGNNAISKTAISIIGAVVLPVALHSFTASLVNSQAQLNWQTTSEIDFHHFDVEKSFDSKNFSLLSTVNAVKKAGVSAYEYVDFSKSLDLQYYRLKMVDNNGSYKYSAIVAVNGKATTNVQVFPNPVANYAIVSHPKATAGAFLWVISMDGRSVALKAVQVGATKTSLDVSSLMRASYIVSFENNGTKMVTKLIK
ncbi:T9SS type A sorting domain-containing protein [Parasediminibacterium sp. JCM 36343]|uniref:T9SS type A sorting domain-containing protein n=1 Tax=Parasediminibacterium sp. JCM 36343 TaxID=3374279 RepID=UPI00397DFE6C